MSLHPRMYLSYSQMIRAEHDPKGFIEDYVYGEKKGTSRAMAYGSQLADSLETGELSGDMAIDIMSTHLPRFERMDVPIEDHKKGVEVEYWRHGVCKKYKVPALRANDGSVIPILAVPDTAREDYSGIKEYKSGVTKWNQKKADESGQITFYCMGAFLTTGVIPKDIELIHLPTHYIDGRPQLTGEMHPYPTQRHMAEILNMMIRARRTWATIGTLMEHELIA